MMTSHTLKSVHFTKTQKSRYLENERLFFLQIKKFMNYTSKAPLLQKNSFVAEVNFKELVVLQNDNSVPPFQNYEKYCERIQFIVKLRCKPPASNFVKNKSLSSIL